MLEAEAIWGDELFTRIRHYIELINPDTSQASKEAITKIDNKAWDIMYDYLSEELDEFKKDLISAIEEIEKYLKPKLSHEKV